MSDKTYTGSTLVVLEFTQERYLEIGLSQRRKELSAIYNNAFVPL